MAPAESNSPAAHPATSTSVNDAATAMLNIEVVYCPGPGVCDRVELRLPPGATVADALAASGLAEKHGLLTEALRLGVWCKPREAHSVLRERDRVEVYRPLTVDPKEARRQRYQQHKASLAARPKRPGPARPAAVD